MAALAVRPTGAVAEVYSCEIKEWVRANDGGLVQPAPGAPFIRQVSIDKEIGNAVGDALWLQTDGKLLKRVRKKTRS